MKEYNINLNHNRKHIIIQVWTPVTLNLAVSFTSSFSSLGSKLKLSRVVIDIRNTKSASSIVDKYFYAYKSAELSGLSRSWRIALLKEANDKSADFLETVMINAGYQFKIFTNEKFASDWLKAHSKL